MYSFFYSEPVTKPTVAPRTPVVKKPAVVEAPKKPVSTVNPKPTVAGSRANPKIKTEVPAE